MSRRYDTMRSFMLTLWRGAPTGRLLARNPATGGTHVVSEGFW